MYTTPIVCLLLALFVTINSQETTENSDVSNNEDDDVYTISNLRVSNATANQVTLEWDNKAKVDFYRVEVKYPENYPNLPTRTTYKNKFIFNHLSPGVRYNFLINSVINKSEGPQFNTSFENEGEQLPEVKSLQLTSQKLYNKVKILWEIPFSRNYKNNWTYGVYFGEDLNDFSKGPVLKTQDLFAEINFLKSCKRYYISVGIIGPMGIGPISSNSLKIFTPVDKFSPPQNLTVTMDNKETTKMIVKWDAPCQIVDDPLGYYVIIREYQTSSATVMDVEASKNTTFERKFKTAYGGIYDVKVSTNEFGSWPTRPVRFMVPHFLQPFNLEVNCNREMFLLNWNEPFVPYFIRPFKYEVVISAQADVANVVRVEVQKPPLRFKFMDSFDNYTFSVIFKTVDDRIRSVKATSVSCLRQKT